MIPMVDMRLSRHFAKGAAKYAERNWEKGIPEDRYVAAAKRHMNQWLMGEDDEDHLIAWLWNVYCLVATEEMIERGILPQSLRNLPDYRSKNKDWEALIERAKGQAAMTQAILDSFKAIERSNRKKVYKGRKKK
jgi:hypothetical protein